MTSVGKSVAAAVAVALSGATASAGDLKSRALEVAETDLQAWIQLDYLIYAIREQNERHVGLGEADIAALDAAWIAEGGDGPMAGDILSRQASVMLRDRRQRAGGLITEIMVFDRHGLLVALSDWTEDFMQGDEAKYLETYAIGADAIHVSDREFDPSTGLEQIDVSLTVQDPETGEGIGGVTISVDPEMLRDGS